MNLYEIKNMETGQIVHLQFCLKKLQNYWTVLHMQYRMRIIVIMLFTANIK